MKDFNHDPLEHDNKINKSTDNKTLELPEEEIKDILPDINETRCGFASWHPRWMRNWARPETYLLIFTLMFWCQNTLYSYTQGNITTVERRFKLSSKSTGFILTGRNLVQIFLAIPLAQIAGKGHRPRWMAFGLCLTMISCFLMMLPHVLFGASSYDIWISQHQNNNISVTGRYETDASGELCSEKTLNKAEKISCEEDSTWNSMEATTVVILQFTAQALFGVNYVFAFTIAYTYMDESVEKDKSPFVFAISGASRVIGPLTGAMLSSWTLSSWVDPHLTPTITKDHPQWIGAWWIGYPIISALFLLPFIGLMLLPRMLPGTRERMMNKLTLSYHKNKEEFRVYKEHFRSKNSASEALWPSFQRIMKNKVYIALTLHQVIFWATTFACIIFTPKYMENAFSISASEAMKYVGTVGVVSSAIGWISVGAFMSFGKPRTKVILQIVTAMSIIMAITYFTMMSIACESPPVEGLSVQLQDTKIGAATKLINSHRNKCILECECSETFSPVCVEYQNSTSLNQTHRLSFFNPCFAGCKDKLSSAYVNCTCAEHVHPFYETSDVTGGLCSSECSMLSLYLFFVGVIHYLVSANRAVRNIIFFRCVDEKDKDLSLGILSVVISAALALYFPILGYLIDSCCSLWQKKCGNDGYCYIYDMTKFRRVHHFLPGVGIVLCILFDLLLLKWHKSLDLLGKKEEDRFERNSEK